MVRFQRSLFFIFIQFTLVPLLVAAETPRNPYQVAVTISPQDPNSQDFYLTLRSGSGLYERFTLVRREDFTPKITIDGSPVSHFSYNAIPSSHFQARRGGVARGGRGRTPDGVGASIYNSKLMVRFVGRRGQSFLMSMSLPVGWEKGYEAVAKLRRTRRSRTFGCSEPVLAHLSGEAEAGSSSTSGSTQRALSQRRVLEVATDADAEYNNSYGSESLARIQSVLNTVESVYLDQLNMSIRITEQNIFTSTSTQPYTSRRSETLLGQFQSYTENNDHLGNFDVAHLFSGKNLAADVLGIAFLGSVCFERTLSYSLGQDVDSSVNWIIVGHELGHNLGAVHDSSTASIMFPRVSAEHTAFSDFTVNQIVDFVEDTTALSGGSCLAVATSPFPLEGTFPAAFTRADSQAVLSTNVTDIIDEDCSFELYVTDDQELLKKKKRYSRVDGLRRVGVFPVSAADTSLSFSFEELARSSVRRRSRLFLRGEVLCSGSRYRTSRSVFRTPGAVRRATRNIRNTLQLSRTES